eukprot:6882473-Alexandrium_andersonii.AAC.1
MADLGRRRNGFEAAAEGPTGGQGARNARLARGRAGAAPRDAVGARRGAAAGDGREEISWPSAG